MLQLRYFLIHFDYSVKRLNDEIDNLQSSINGLKQEQVTLKVREQ